MTATTLDSWYATENGQYVEACSQVDPEVMFPDEKLDNNAPEVLDAKGVCAGCFFRDACKTRAVARNERYGVWGGTTAKERHAIRRRHYRAPRQDETLDLGLEVAV